MMVNEAENQQAGKSTQVKRPVFDIVAKRAPRGFIPKPVEPLKTNWRMMHLDFRKWMKICRKISAGSQKMHCSVCNRAFPLFTSTRMKKHEFSCAKLQVKRPVFDIVAKRAPKGVVTKPVEPLKTNWRTMHLEFRKWVKICKKISTGNVNSLGQENQHSGHGEANHCSHCNRTFPLLTSNRMKKHEITCIKLQVKRPVFDIVAKRAPKGVVTKPVEPLKTNWRAIHSDFQKWVQIRKRNSSGSEHRTRKVLKKRPVFESKKQRIIFEGQENLPHNMKRMKNRPGWKKQHIQFRKALRKAKLHNLEKEKKTTSVRF